VNPGGNGDESDAVVWSVRLPADLPLTDPVEGTTVELGRLAADPLVIILVRYFGCLPCQAYLAEIDRRREAFRPEAGVVAVGGSAAYQARWLRKVKGIRIPLFLDGQETLRGLVGIGDLGVRGLVAARGWRAYGRALGDGLLPQVPTRHVRRAPGIVALDRDLTVSWSHAGSTLGDYPPVEELVERVNRRR
jgi:hypothetical protein